MVFNSSHLSKFIGHFRAKIRYYWGLTAIFLATTISFLLYYLSLNTAYMYVGIIVFYLPLVFFNSEKCLLFMFLTLPNIAMFKFYGEGNTLIGIFSILLFTRILLFKEIAYIPRGIVIAVALHIITILTTTLYVGNTALVLSEVRFIITIVLIIAILYNNRHRMHKYYDEILNTFVFGCIASIICGLIYSTSIGRFASVNADPNFFSLIMAIAISMLCLELLYSDKNRIFITVQIFFLLYGATLSISRGFLLAVSLNVIILVFFFLKRSRIKYVQKIVIIGLLLFAVNVFWNPIYNTYSNYQVRFNDDSFATGGGRTEAWNLYIDMTFSNIGNALFGMGSESELYRQGIFPRESHNLFVQQLTSLGVIGSLIAVNLYYGIFKTIGRICKARITVISLFPLFTWAVGYMFLSALLVDTQIICFILVVLCGFVNSKRGAYHRNIVMKKQYLSRNRPSPICKQMA